MAPADLSGNLSVRDALGSSRPIAAFGAVLAFAVAGVLVAVGAGVVLCLDGVIARLQ